MRCRLKRVYEAPEENDGFRVLVDRLWPRGLAREKSAIHYWMKELAPSDALRKWFDHQPTRWPEFRRRYRAELGEREEGMAALQRMAHGKTLTLLFAARDSERNNAVVLRELLEAR